MKRWYVARTKPARETVAAVAIAEKGYPVFLPITLVTRTHARKRETVSKPLFPRYIFANFDAADPTANFTEINYCRGVASKGLIVNADSKPIAVPDKVIQAIRDSEMAAKARVGEARTGYHPGDTFKVEIGPFASFDATYIGEDRGIVHAFVHIFGRDNLVKFPFEDVPPCQRSIDNWAA